MTILNSMLMRETQWQIHESQFETKLYIAFLSTSLIFSAQGFVKINVNC